MAAKMPNSEALAITRWKWPTTKYVSCRYWSTGADPRYRPVSPPATNSDTNPSAKSMAGVRRMLPPHRVNSQLKVFTADGTAMMRVVVMKAVPSHGFMPLTNMWWPHTRKPRIPMALVDSTMAL